jgi:SAM-dependent methyltransferase
VQKPFPDFSDCRLWEPLPACPLCQATGFRKAFDARDRHLGNPGTFQVMCCGECGAYFLNPMPTLEYLKNAYPRDYYAYSGPSASRTRSPVRKRIRRFIRRAIFFTSGWTRDPEFPKPGCMLDIGCGVGLLLLEMREKGWTVHGVELDSDAAVAGRQEGLDIFGGTLHDAAFPPAAFDYVRSNHSFEHIHNPREVLREIRRILRPGGHLFIGVPNLAGLMPKMWGTYWWYLGSPVHTYGYTPASISSLLTEEGFRVERISYNSTYAGITGSLQIWLNRNNGRGAEEGWVVKNLALRLFGHWLAQIIDRFQAGDCMEVIARPVCEQKERAACSPGRQESGKS